MLCVIGVRPLSGDSMANTPSKQKVQGRGYTPEELALFACYVDTRRDVKPKACDEGAGCWVLVGPPAFDRRGGRSRCLRCQASLMTGIWGGKKL